MGTTSEKEEFLIFKKILFFNFKSTYDSDAFSDGLWWQISSEFGTDTTAVTMWSGHLTPNNSDVIWFGFLAAGYSSLTLVVNLNSI